MALNGNQLEKAFTEQGGPGQRKERERKANRKKQFLEDIITFKLIDEKGDDLKGCVFKVMRKRISRENLQDLVDICPHPCLLDYVYDKSGEVIWMEDIQLAAKSDNEYVIVPVILREPYDICRDAHYDGQTVFAMQYVPFYARDESTFVDAEALRQWLLFAILEEDPFVPPILEQIERQKGKIKDVDRRLKAVVKQEFLEPDGKEMLPEKAELEREALFKAIGEERDKLDLELKRREALLITHREWRSNMGITCEEGDTDEHSNTITWFVRFDGVNDARDMENRLLSKNDFSGIRLACGCAEKKMAPWVGRSAVPDGTKANMPDYTQLQVNIAGVRIMRLPHGVGVLKGLERRSTYIHSDKFYYYYGNFYAGKKMGYGIEVNDSGMYSGRFVDNWRDGWGRWELPNGTVVKGSFGKKLCFPEHNSSLDMEDHNPYLDGEPLASGESALPSQPPQQVEIMFADGGFYRGAMQDGKITGRGEYQSGFGEVYSGSFLNGVLHCDNGYYLSHDKEEFRGSFVRGELHGRVKTRHPRGDSFDGYYDHSLRNGRGEANYKNKGIYRGYYVNGYRHGKGEVDYMKRDLDEYFEQKKAAAKAHAEQAAETKAHGRSGDKEAEDEEDEPLEEVVPEYQMRFQGYMLADTIMRGSGTVTDQEEQVPRILSIHNKQRMDPLNALFRRIANKAKRNKRIMEKMTDMEHYVRREIVRKKTRIFNQQKHFTKKSIYQNELYGPVDEQILRSKAIVREERLKRVQKMKKSFSSDAFIPRLRKKPDKFPNDHLQGVFTHIKPEDGSQDQERVGLNIPIAKILVSDFEEIGERGRFLKYNAILERAEAAFQAKKLEDKNA